MKRLFDKILPVILLASCLLVFGSLSSCASAEHSPAAGGVYASGSGAVRSDGNLTLVFGTVQGDGLVFLKGATSPLVTKTFVGPGGRKVTAFNAAAGTEQTFEAGEFIPAEFEVLFIDQADVNALSSKLGWQIVFEGGLPPPTP